MVHKFIFTVSPFFKSVSENEERLAQCVGLFLLGTEGRCCRMAKLTAKQQRFCDEYLIDLNATQAAIRAGYSKKYANTNASKLLQITTIRQYIDARMAEKESQLIADQDEVLKYLTSVLRGESQSTEVVVEGQGDGYSEARTIQKEPSEKDRLKAAELLGKRYGIYTDKVEADVDMELNINIDYGDEE
nr:MAG TPA: Terminase small subunit [Caudoviricetes sp.]